MTSQVSKSTDIQPLETATLALEKEAKQALAAENASTVAEALKKVEQKLSSAGQSLDTLELPKKGVGVIAADAKILVGKLAQLEEDAERSLEAVITKSPNSSVAFEDFLLQVEKCQGRARRLVAGNATSDPELLAIKASLEHFAGRLESVRERLASFALQPPLPFQAEVAEIRIAASGELARALVAPLVAAWSGSEVVSGGDGNLYLSGGPKGNILVEAQSAEDGFEMLAAGEIAVFFADRAPTSEELAYFSANYRESRSVAEVIALDALTLLVNPQSELSVLQIGSNLPLRLAAGDADSSLRRKAASFGFPMDAALEVPGEKAVLDDGSLLGLGLYHQEGTNLKAKRLAVQASPETQALKPSPFTIATEDYLFTYRIVAWTHTNPSGEALALIKFATSNQGQAIVARQGFVDLRLAGSQDDVPQEFLAALGAAIGSETISSAIRLSTNFRFEVGKADLDLKAQADLERLPRFVFDTYPTYKVVILGFTDSDGGPEINVPLSKKRAEAVASDLKSSKVDAHASGVGAVFPVDSNATAAGKAKNRRAEVWVVRP